MLDLTPLVTPLARRLAKRSFTMYATRIFVVAGPRVNGDTSSVTAAIKSPNVAFLGNAKVIVIALRASRSSKFAALDLSPRYLNRSSNRHAIA
jgi:hypothetical protein